MLSVIGECCQSCARARAYAEMPLTRVDLAQLVIGDGRNEHCRG